MHLQYNIHDWPKGLIPGLNQVVVACDMGSLFEECARINPQSVRVLRHVDDPLQQFSDTWEGSLWLARRWWGTFIDGTFREKYARFTNYVKGYNETLANSQTPEEKYQVEMLERALAHVWNTEYRIQDDYAHIRPVLGSAAVGNDIPESIAAITVEYDAVLSYHPYFYISDGIRPDWEFENLSGRWMTMEEEWYGTKPEWIFTEGGPFESAEEGWRSSKCLDGDVDAYIAAMRTQVREIMASDAHREGRVIGAPVWFTSGGGDKWRHFETTANELERLAGMLYEEWQPGTAPPVEPPIEPPEPGTPKYVSVVPGINWLNLRETPGGKDIGDLHSDSGLLEVVGKDRDWYKVAGWAHGNWLTPVPELDPDNDPREE